MRAPGSRSLRKGGRYCCARALPLVRTRRYRRLSCEKTRPIRRRLPLDAATCRKLGVTMHTAWYWAVKDRIPVERARRLAACIAHFGQIRMRPATIDAVFGGRHCLTAGLHKMSPLFLRIKTPQHTKVYCGSGCGVALLARRGVLVIAFGATKKRILTMGNATLSVGAAHWQGLTIWMCCYCPCAAGAYPQKVGSKPVRCARMYERAARAQRNFCGKGDAAQ